MAMNGLRLAHAAMCSYSVSTVFDGSVKSACFQNS